MKDLEVFHPDRMASRIIGMGDVMSLIEKAEEAFTQEEAADAAQAMVEGEFTLEDLRDQLRKLRKMGPLASLLEMIPGFGALKGASSDLDEGSMRKVEAVLDSMTHEERRNPALINGSRRRRIARGSGTHVQDVNALLKQHAQMRKMMRTLSRTARGRRGPGRLPFPFR
jgi:signal recognition particle subunit SRP54